MFFFGKSDIGKRRSTNQDCFNITSLSDGSFLCTVCDGMGGANGGNIASEIASNVYTSYIKEHIEDESENKQELIFRAIVEANSAVFKKASSDEVLNGMGTTLVSALIDKNGNATIVNVGDSRMYMLYDDDLDQLTHDHSYVQMLVDMGQITKEEAATNPRRNILTRAVGTEKVIEVDITSMEIPEGDVYFLLCSDGLYNFVSEDSMKNIMRAPLEGFDDDYDAELSQKVKTLIDRANENGGGDNITIILVRQPDANN